MDIVAVDDHVTQVDVDAEPEPPGFNGCGLIFGTLGLPGHGAGDGIHDTGELDQHAVAHEFYDPPAMFGDQGFQHMLAQLGIRRV